MLLAGLSVTISLALIPIVSRSIRGRYVRFVQTAMRSTGRAAHADDQTFHPETATVAPQVYPPAAAEQLLARAAVAARGAARSYLLAGMAFGLWSGGVVAAPFLLAGALALVMLPDRSVGAVGVVFAALTLLIFAVLAAPLFAWPIVVTLRAIGLVTTRVSGVGWMILSGYFLIVGLATGGLLVVGAFVLLPAVLIVVVASSGVRGVSWFVAPLCLTAPAFALGLLFAATRADVGEMLAVLGVLALFVLLTGLRLWSVITLYTRKRVSDDTLFITQWWFTQNVVVAAFAAVLSPWAGLAAFGAYAVFSAVLSAGLRRAHREALRHPPVRLLLLRTFGYRRRSTRMLSTISAHWRWIGSIQVIAGPDLAAATLEPHELLDFIRGRMGDRVVGTPSDIDARLADLDLVADRDGRYRVNDFFCAGDVWQATLRRLVATSHAVLIDLRGFEARHAGVIYEIEQLVLLSALHRVVAIVDGTTSMDVLQHTLHRAWSALPGGRAPAPGEWIGPHVVQVRKGRRPDARRVFEALCHAAALPLGTCYGRGGHP